MKTFVLLLPVILSGLVLAAHLLRGANPLGVLISLGAVSILAFPKPWAARLVQAFLVLGSLEWIRTTLVLVGERKSLGAPWIRMAAILIGVALFTAASALAFQGARMKQRYVLAQASRED